MTRPKSANDLGVAEGPAWTVRIAIGAMVIHCVSRTEPVVRRGGGPGAGVLGVELEPIEGTEHGDTLGFVRWSRVDAVTWRRAAARKRRPGHAAVTASDDDPNAAALGVALLEAVGPGEVFSVSRSRARAQGDARHEPRVSALFPSEIPAAQGPGQRARARKDPHAGKGLPELAVEARPTVSAMQQNGRQQRRVR